MKRRNILTRLLTGAVSATMVAGMLPVSALAVAGDQIAADGDYSATVTVVNDSDDEDEWENYGATVKLTVKDGVFTGVDINAETTNTDDLKCLKWAKEGRTKSSGTTYNGLDNIVGKAATEATLDEYVDVVTGATCASRDLMTAAKAAIADAPEASEEEKEVKYVIMNVPYELFFEAYGLTDANIEEIAGVEYDAISTATTSKFLGTTGLAEGTYNDGTNILGVTLPVAVDSDDYANLKTGLTEKDNFYYTDLEAAPDSYSTLTVNEDGSYSFSMLEESDVDVSSVKLLKDEDGSLTDLLTNSYGDYYLELEGMTPDGIISATGVDLKVYGAYLTIDEAKYGMVALENLWFGTRYDYLQIAWSVESGKQLHKSHNNAEAPLYYQFAHNGGKLTAITLITDQGLITIDVNETLPAYYAGDLSGLTYSITNDAKELKISGIPKDLENVKVSVAPKTGKSLAEDAEVKEGVVALSDLPQDGVSYTLSISSDNYPDITRTMSTPISEAQKEELAALMEKAKGTTGYDKNDTLQEHVGEAAAMIAADTNTSVEAAELVGELELLIKQTYPKATAAADLKGTKLTISDLKDADGKDLELSALKDPTYTLSYRQGKQVSVLASGSLDDMVVALDKEPAVGTEYTLTIESDSYQDITASVTARAAYVYVTMNVPYELFFEAYGLTDANIEEIAGVEYDAISTATTSKFLGTTGLAEGTYNDGTNILGVTLPVAVDSDDYADLKTGLTEKDNFYYTDLEAAPDSYSTLTVNEDGSYSFSMLEESDVDVSSVKLLKDENGSLEDLLTNAYGDYYLELEGMTPDGIISATGVDLKVYGAYLTIDEAKYGMVALENLWFGTRYDYLQIAWSVESGKQLHKSHNNAAAPLYYQFAHNGGKLTAITLITDQGLITINADETLPAYYAGDLSQLTYSITNDVKELKISGIPKDLENVKVSVASKAERGSVGKNLATDAEVKEGVVVLSDLPQDGVSYTLSISSDNYPDITRTMSTPISEAQKEELAALMEKAKGTTGYDKNDMLQEHVEEAAAMIAADTNTSVEAAELVGELELLIKQTYPKATAAAELKGTKLTISDLKDEDGKDLELSALKDPAYTLSYRQGKQVSVLTSGSLDGLTVTLDAEPTVGTEYTLTIESDSYQDITVSVTAADEVKVPDGLSDTKDADGNWYYYKDGKVATDVTTVAQNKNGWYYVENGKVNFKYTGFATNENGKWYVEKGQVKFNKSSVIKDETGALGTKGAWYYVINSEVKTNYTGVANHKNDNGWWYVENGKVNFKYTGFSTNKNGKWYVEKGQVKFDKSSVIKDTNGALGTKGTWYYVVGSKVQTDYTGVANHKNANGWWYVENGKVNFKYTGFSTNKNGKWYVEKGQVKFNKSSVIKDATGALGTKGAWYYVVNSKVQTGYTGVANHKNANGWWYVKNGKVDFTANTVAKNKNGWWRVEGGKVNFEYHGIASNANGRWYIKNGKVDFSFTGTVKTAKGTYKVVKGKVQ